MFTDDQVNELRKRFEFRPDYDRARELDRVADRFTYHSRLHFSTFGERRKVIAKLNKQIPLLLVTLTELKKSGGSYLVKAKLIEELKALQAKTKRKAETVEKKSSTRKPDYARGVLVRDLFQTYRVGTWRNDHYSQLPGTNTYYGPTVDFITEVCLIIGVDLSNSFIGKELKSLLAELRTDSHKK